MRRTKGFTLVELLVVMTVLSILAGLGMLRYIDMKNSARAAAVAGDFDVVKVATYNYWADFDAWPANAGAGAAPPGMAPYLPGGFSFTRPDYTLDFENLGTSPGVPYQIGVTVTSTDAKLMAKLIQYLGTKAPFFVAGNALTYMIVGANGAKSGP